MARVTPSQVRSLINASETDIAAELVEEFLDDADAEISAYIDRTVNHFDCSPLEASVIKLHAALSCLIYLQGKKAGSDAVQSFSIGDLSISKKSLTVESLSGALAERLEKILDILKGANVRMDFV